MINGLSGQRKRPPAPKVQARAEVLSPLQMMEPQERIPGRNKWIYVLNSIWRQSIRVVL